MKELTPCPFCGSDRLKLFSTQVYNKWVMCEHCHTIGPTSPNTDTAVDKGNDRVVDKTKEFDSNFLVRIVDKLFNKKHLCKCGGKCNV